MTGRGRWSRALVIAGLIAMIAGAIDPLEGSVVILAGAVMVALGARLGGSRRTRFLFWSLGLMAAGVGVMFGLSALGGIGGRSGRSLWWGLLILPYPAGWIMGLIGAVRRLREDFVTR